MAVEQDASPPRVLAEDEVSLPELVEHAQGDVAEIPDGRGADGERHGRQSYQAPSSASKPTSPAPTSPASVPNSADTRGARASAGVGPPGGGVPSPRVRPSPTASPNPPPTTTSS